MRGERCGASQDTGFTKNCNTMTQGSYGQGNGTFGMRINRHDDAMGTTERLMPHTWQSTRIPDGKRDTKSLLEIELMALLQRQRMKLVNVVLKMDRKNLKDLGIGSLLHFLDPLEKYEAKPHPQEESTAGCSEYHRISHYCLLWYSSSV